MKKIYDYDAWFDGEPDPDGRTRFVLVAGEHYDCSQSSMMQQLRIAAVHRRCRLSVADMRDRLVVSVEKRPVTATV